ncbi:hypothetical protein [Accumulibacter sp.]|uniref:hypothetical protein n=1 Tax=Accumulibacter sp. TaxID=2053492 RepID=UPI0025D4E358|nr:hypothetical protein [Accumulibacter sp.]
MDSEGYSLQPTHSPGSIMNKKLILPTEVKVCATCSYWDGERKVDSELRVVVVNDSCAGECLVQTKPSHGLNDVRRETENCVWEHLAPDDPAADLDPDELS